MCDRNVTDFEDRWAPPIDINQNVQGNAYVDPNDTQRRLDIFSQVKAATVVPAVETNTNDSSETENDEDLSEVSTFSYCHRK